MLAGFDGTCIEQRAEGGCEACASESGVAMLVRLAVAECVTSDGSDVRAAAGRMGREGIGGAGCVLLFVAETKSFGGAGRRLACVCAERRAGRRGSISSAREDEEEPLCESEDEDEGGRTCGGGPAGIWHAHW